MSLTTSESDPVGPTPKIAVGLYLHGAELDPIAISDATGVEATIQHCRGHRYTLPGGRNAVRKSGLWAIESATESNDVNEHVKELGARAELLRQRIVDGSISIETLPGVENAYVDIFYVSIDYPPDRKELRFDLSPLSARVLSDLGVSIHVTVGY